MPRPTPHQDERGANLVEYGLLVLLISLVALAAVTFFGEELGRLWDSISSEVSTASA